MIDPDAAVAFLNFVEERHRVWRARQAGLPQPWTSDPIIASRKFTNVFRAIDPGSQFLIANLLDSQDSARDVLMRCFLYRHTNLPSAWEAYAIEHGEMPRVGDLQNLLEFWWGYKANGGKLFSGAYTIYPQSSTPGTDKITSVINLTARLFTADSPDDIVPDFLASQTQADRFATLRRNKGVADFMSMQILTDWGYSPQCGEDREHEFVVGGPGCIKGAAEIDPDAKTSDMIRWASTAINTSPNAPELLLDDYDENYRTPSLMDVQNCFCEFSKYARVARKSSTSAQKPYRPAHPALDSTLVLPKHW